MRRKRDWERLPKRDVDAADRTFAHSLGVRTSDRGAAELDDLPGGINDLFIGKLVRVKGLLFRDLAGELIFEAKRVDGTP